MKAGGAKVNRNPDQSKNSNKTTVEQPTSGAKANFSGKIDSTKPEDLEDKIELERREAYIEPRSRDILRNLLALGDNAEISPTYNSELGFIYKLPDAANKDETDVVSFDRLLNLARLDILSKSFFDSASSCPNCESITLTLHNRCPKCKSHNVEKTSLTEHFPCGNIDQRDKYTNNRCPKCGELLVEGQYQNMGRWYICQSCRDRFENSEYDLICHSCDKSFTIKESKIRTIPKFSLNMQRKKEIRQNVASLEDIRSLLKELEFDVEVPGLTIGLKSGMQHHFSLIAKKMVGEQEIVIALDHAVSELEVQTSPLILYIYKISEVKVDIPIFVVMPQLSDTARRIAQGHEILLVEGTTEDPECTKNIRLQIEERIRQKTIVPNIQIAPIVPVEIEEEKKPEKSSSFFNKLGIKKK